MGVEAATYISDLNPLWPLGSDYREAGDNHLRLIKAVIQATFPNINGAVTADQDDLNNPALESATVALFFQAAAPTGWTRQNTGDAINPWMPVIAVDGDPGAEDGGSDSPILNDTVPEHNHTGTVTVDSGNATHDHSFDYDGSPNARSYIGIFDETYGSGIQSATRVATGSVAGSDHQYAVGEEDAAHTHTASTSIANNAGAADWTPLYYTGILCAKD